MNGLNLEQEAALAYLYVHQDDEKGETVCNKHARAAMTLMERGYIKATADLSGHVIFLGLTDNGAAHYSETRSIRQSLASVDDEADELALELAIEDLQLKKEGKQRFVTVDDKRIDDYWTLKRHGLIDGFPADNTLMTAEVTDAGRAYAMGDLSQMSTTSPLDSAIDFLKTEFASNHISEQLDLLIEIADEHPTDAIGKSKELLESCCKTILNRQGVQIMSDWDTPKLCKETAKVLRVSAGDYNSDIPENKPIKKVLGNLQGLATGLVELRNAYGDGHGHDAEFQPLSPRYARLAVGSCLTLVLFYWETYEWNKSQGFLSL